MSGSPGGLSYFVIGWSWRRLWWCCCRWRWPAPAGPLPSRPPSPLELVCRRETMTSKHQLLVEVRTDDIMQWVPQQRRSHDVTGLVPVLHAVIRLPFLLCRKRGFYIFGACMCVLHAAPRSICEGAGRVNALINAGQQRRAPNIWISFFTWW